MAKVKKPGKKASKKPQLKKSHKKHFTDFLKVLSNLGLDVNTYAKKLGMEEQEISKLERKIEEKSSLTDAEKEKLRKILQDLFDADTGLYNIELSLYNQAKPLVDEANKRFPSMNLASLHVMKRVSDEKYKEKAKEVQADVSEIRDYVMASIHQEKVGVFDAYPKLLNKVETSFNNLIKLEEKLKTKGKLRKEFLKLHTNLRKILHQDIYNISRDIVDVYNLRLQIYRKLLGIDREICKRAALFLLQEYYLMLRVQHRYVLLFREHADYFTKVYGGAK